MEYIMGDKRLGLHSTKNCKIFQTAFHIPAFYVLILDLYCNFSLNNFNNIIIMVVRMGGIWIAYPYLVGLAFIFRKKNTITLQKK
jgi:hypothetical protein